MIARFLELLTALERTLASALIFFLTILVIVDVFSRELFKLGLPWAQKGAVYLMIWAGFIGAVLVAQKVEHLRPEVTDKLWKGRARLWFLRVQNFVVLCFTLGMTYYSFLYVSESRGFGDKNIILGVHMWVLQAVIPYCFLSMSLRYLYFTVFPREKDPQAVH